MRAECVFQKKVGKEEFNCCETRENDMALQEKKIMPPPWEALQNPLLPSRMKQKCSVRFFFTTSKNGVFLPSQ